MTTPLQLALASPEPSIDDFFKPPVFMDLETRSYLDLRQLGPWRYMEDCEIVTAGWLTSPERIVLQTAVPVDLERVIPEEAAELGFPHLRAEVAEPPDGPWVAHNAWGFDDLVWHACGRRPTVFLDSLPIARACGLPGRLDLIGSTLFNRGKDDTGSKVTRSLSKPLRATGRLPPLNRSNVGAVARYMVLDILILAAAWRTTLHKWLQRNAAEIPLLLADRRINRRGVRFNGDLAQRCIDREEALREDVATEAGRVLGDAAEGNPRGFLRRRAALLQWFAGRGHELPNTQRDTLQDFAEETDDEDAALVASACVGCSTVTTSKLVAGLKRRCSDGRLRGLLLFHGAGTGRWTSFLVQLHNLTKGDGSADAALGRLLAGDASVADLRCIVRLCFGAGYLADLSGIEARGSRWLAGDAAGLQRFFDPGYCIYREAAAVIYGIPIDQVDKKKHRPTGKVAELAGQYQGGEGAVLRFCEMFGIDPATLPKPPREIVEAFRDANPLIAGTRTGELWNDRVLREGGIWKDYQAAFRAAATDGTETQVGLVRFGRDSGDNLVLLPSGRVMVYRRARVAKRPRFGEMREGLVYDGVKAGCVVTEDTYGGKLFENVNQAACRDFFAHGLLELERQGLEPVLHVHDEGIWEKPCSLRRGVIALSTVPPWAPGFPLGAEGFESEEYRKEPEGRPTFAALCGEEIR